MGSSKLKLSLVAFLATTSLYSESSFQSEFEAFQNSQNNNFLEYKDNLEKEFEAYKKAYDDAFKEYSSSIKKNWPSKEPDVTNKVKWVEYSDNYNSKKSIDYEKKEISIEVIAKDEDEAKKKIEKLFDDTIKKDVKKASQDDVLEKKVYEKLKQKQPVVKSNQKLIADIITAQESIKLKKKIEKEPLKKVSYNGKFIYKANVKLPSDTTIRKAKEFKSDVVKNSNKQEIPAELIYAIMHSESSFNPMARSHIPAFGLMQIVPKTAGIDSYQYLYKQKKVLSSSYLYKSSNNILIGSAYLHILYYRYLKNIKDPQSKLYCTIAAYNTGAGNVAKAFIGNTNIYKASSKINAMSSDEVYNTLMKKLPYNETKVYLKKVSQRASVYNKLLATSF